jgi:hypothetical protein
MNYAVYGVDADGDEREYVMNGTEEEYKEWEKAGPVWRQAQDAIIGRLLDNPATRDWVIELNALAAYEKGDVDTAVRRFQHLSAKKWDRLSSEAEEVERGEKELDNPEAQELASSLSRHRCPRPIQSPNWGLAGDRDG